MRQWIVINRSHPYVCAESVNQLWFNIGGTGGQGSSIYHVTITEGTRQSPRWDVVVTPQAAYIDTVQGERAIQQRRQSQECNSWVLGHLRSHPRGRTVRQMDTHSRQATGMWRRRHQRRLDPLAAHHATGGAVELIHGRETWFFVGVRLEMSVKNGPLHVGGMRHAPHPGASCVRAARPLARATCGNRGSTDAAAP